MLNNTRNVYEIQSSRKLLDENIATIDQLTDERDALQVKVGDMLDQQDIQIQKQIDNTDNVQRQLDRAKATNKVHLETQHGLEATILKLKKDVLRVTEQLNSVEASYMKDEINQKNDIIQGLNLKLVATQGDLEMLAADWDRLDKQVKVWIW